jgi:cytochrome c biogenesis protein CcmG, thiol:disulfide interchange protein DsbE
MTVRSGFRLAAALGTTLLVFSGCGDGGVDTSATYTFDPADARVDVDTPELRQAKAAAAIEPCPETDLEAQGSEGGLPALVLPCLGGGAAVNLAGLGSPTVINLWAQYCGPCRTEAPRFQQVHEAADGDVTIIGIDWQDPLPGRAIAFADEYGLTYPQVADPDAATRAPLRVSGLPVTLFVDADGTVQHAVYGEVKSAAELVGLIQTHLGVEVAL